MLGLLSHLTPPPHVLVACTSTSGIRRLHGGTVSSSWGRALLEGEGCDRGKFQSGCRAVTGDVQAVGRRLLAVGNAVGAGVGVWECLWGRVRARVLGGRGVPPPLSSNSLSWGEVSGINEPKRQGFSGDLSSRRTHTALLVPRGRRGGGGGGRHHVSLPARRLLHLHAIRRRPPPTVTGLKDRPQR